MKAVAFNGSPRKNGNTAQLLSIVLQTLEKEGIETEMVQLGGKPVRGCIGCRKCAQNKDRKCIINSDIINECIAKMDEADVILIGSPTYFSNVTTEVKALIDRAGVIGRANDYMFKHKIGAAVVAVRRAGSNIVFDAINKPFFINQMIVPGSTYWNMGQGAAEGDVNSDEEGKNNMVNLGENIAWLLKKIK